MNPVNSLVGLAEKSAELDHQLMVLGGELNPDIEAQLSDIDTQLVSKADAYAAVLNRALTTAQDYKRREDEFKAARKSIETAVDRIRDRIKYAMKLMGKDEIQGRDVRFKLSATKPALVIENEKILAAQYKTEIVTVEANKDLIRGALESGVEVVGARLEHSSALRVTSGPRRDT